MIEVLSIGRFPPDGLPNELARARIRQQRVAVLFQPGLPARLLVDQKSAIAPFHDLPVFAEYA